MDSLYSRNINLYHTSPLVDSLDVFFFNLSVLGVISVPFVSTCSAPNFSLFPPGFNSLVGGIMGFSILLSAEVFKHNASVWYLDGSIGILIGLTIFAYGAK